jgi:hypothetical protein
MDETLNHYSDANLTEVVEKSPAIEIALSADECLLLVYCQVF